MFPVKGRHLGGLTHICIYVYVYMCVCVYRVRGIIQCVLNTVMLINHDHMSSGLQWYVSTWASFCICLLQFNNSRDGFDCQQIVQHGPDSEYFYWNTTTGNNSWYQPICEWQESFTLPYFLYFICRRHGEHFKRLVACCKTFTHYVGHFQDEYNWVTYCNIWMTKSFRIGNCECFLGLPYPILLVAGKRLKQSEGEV